MRGKLPDKTGSKAAKPIFTGSAADGNLRIRYSGGDGTAPAQLPQGPTQAAMDSGMVSAYRPAQHTKPGLAGFMERIQRTVSAWRGQTADPGTTTQVGSATAEPAVYQFELYQLRYERRATIEECRRMYLDDPRIRQSVDAYVEEAVRDGFNIVIHNKVNAKLKGTQLHTLQSARLDKVLQCKSDTEKALNPEIDGYGKMLMVEGDSFIQIDVDPRTKRITRTLRMPASGMERLTDDADEFIDVNKAFAQVGTMTNSEIATMPLWSIVHMRWDHVPGDKYGTSRLIAVRRQWRMLKLMEEAQARRRMIRAGQNIVWNLGTEAHPADEDAIKKFKANNGWVEGNRDQWDVTEVGRDFFGGGMLKGEVLEGDQTVHNIEDIEYAQDILMSGLPTPAALLPVAARLINRDVLKDQRAQWLLSTKKLSNMLRDQLVSYVFELSLLLQNIDPAEVEYSIHFSESAVETSADIINQWLSLRKNTLGTGPNAIPDPLATRLQVIQGISEVMGWKDPEKAYAQLIAEEKENTKKYGDYMDMRTPEPHAPVPGNPGNKKPSPGKSRNKPSAASDSIATAIMQIVIPDELATENGDSNPDVEEQMPWNGYGNTSALWWHYYGSGPDPEDAIGQY